MLILLSINDEVSSISSKIIKKIEVIPEVVLSEVPKLIEPIMNKKQRLKETVFLRKKDSIK